MSETNKTLLSGMGPLSKVIEAWMGEIGNQDVVEQDIHDASRCLAALLNDPQSERAAFAIACSVLNRQFSSTHRVHFVGDSGECDHETICATHTRAAIQATLSS